MSEKLNCSSGRVSDVLRSPQLLTREALAGVITALALIPEVISFSVIAGVDPKVSLLASVVLCISMSFLGGRPPSRWRASFRLSLASQRWRA